MKIPTLQYISGFLGSWCTLTITPSVFDQSVNVVIAGGVSLIVQILIKWFDKKFLKNK